VGEKISLYRITPEYIDALRDEAKGGDKRVYQIRENNKFHRPFIAVIVMINEQLYAVPLSTTDGKTKLSNKGGDKKGSIDYSPIYINGVLKASVQYSRMIPIDERVLRNLDINYHKHDTKEQKEDKQLRRDELEWVRNREDVIINKARTLYNTYISGVPFKRRDDCLNFIQLEKVSQRYLDNKYNPKT